MHASGLQRKVSKGPTQCTNKVNTNIFKHSNIYKRLNFSGMVHFKRKWGPIICGKR